MAQTRKNRILPLILVLVCAAVMLRSAFTGLEIDEEYALSLGYRLVSGRILASFIREKRQSAVGCRGIFLFEGS